MKQVVALFGEAEKGAFKTPHMLHQLPQLVDVLGNPPGDSEGLFFAVQSILYNREILFFRVAEEGFSRIDYMSGLKYLGDREKVKKMHALCLPGVGDPEILAASESVCHVHKGLLITNQKDLYDFLTSS
ncbi:MAG: hypothetical protein KGQ49_06755 [Verrucomicrobia bacterium]|nr:hypothetical protein [Verrucomicrobiota bacterium]MBU6447080.1 hypothetical protein [Verrucomicrobiota bacterium]MDE3046798.1 hypothetical protein [Verrucomicrobiota bacterium]